MTVTSDSVIQEIIAPAAMIPASGLLLLSSTARMNTVLARVRAFHRERLDVWKQSAAEGSPDHAVRELRLEGLMLQTDRLLTRARLLRITMLQLFAAIGCNLLAVIGLAMRFVLPDPDGVLSRAPAVLFVVGVAIMFGAMVTSFVEVLRIVETVVFEHDRVERLCRTAPDAGASPAMPDRSEGTDVL